MTTTSLADAGRAVFAMRGEAVRTVLQDVVTADVAALAPGRAVYAALLTPQGKYLFDFFLIDGGPLGHEGAVLIDVAEDRAGALAKRLTLYCVRRDAKVTGETGLRVGLLWPAEASGAVEPPEAAPANGIALPDPRHPGLGLRVYAEDPGAVLAATGATPADRGTYAARRIALGVPETGVELVVDDTYPLEAGLDRLGAVDFRKGCYVGQEVTARMRHKATLKKRLVRVAVEGEAAPGTALTTSDGKPAGTLFSQSGGQGLAHLRLDRAGGVLEAGDARVTGVLEDG